MEVGGISLIFKSKLNDNGISVNELLELLNLKDDLTSNLLKALNIKEFETDFISITGAKKLVDVQKGINKGFYKEDFVSSLNDIAVYKDDDNLILSFTNLNKSEYFSLLNLSCIDAIPKYSSKSDFFSWLYGMDKYANELIKNGLDDILLSNLDFLRKLKIGEKDRKYRILQDLHNKQFYVRAIISTDRYTNYDNNITIVIALLTLHSKMKKQDIKYSINRVEYNESCIRIFIEEENKRKLGQLGYVKNIIEISNDEVKRESLKFEAISNIEFTDAEDKLQEIIIQPSSSSRPKIKTSILAIPHFTIPQTFVDKLKEIDNSIKIHEELFNLIEKIVNIKKPSEIMFLVKQRIESAKSDSLKGYKNNIKKILESHNVDNMIQLLSLFKKLELITETDIEASEYIRSVIYDTLIERKVRS